MLSQSLVVNMWWCNELHLKMPKESKDSFFLLLPKGRTFQREFYVSYFFGWNWRKLDGGRETWMTGWQAAIVTLPLGNPAIMLSGRIDLQEGVKKTAARRERAGQRGVRMKVQRGIMFVSKSGWFDFYHAQWKGWHFGNALFLTLAFQINKSL